MFKRILFIVACVFTLAAAAETKYEIDPDMVWVESPVTKGVCSQVGQLSAGVKLMFDIGKTNKEISNSMTAIGLNNLHDSEGWTAIHMVSSERTLNLMRGWTKHEAYRSMERRFPTFNDSEKYEVYGSSLCDNNIGTVFKTLKVNKHVVGSSL